MHVLIALRLATVVTLLLAAPRVAGQPPAVVVVIGATLVDGTGGPPLADSAIVVRDGKVVAVTTAASVSAIPADAQRIDARGKWIIPGLIDMHVHYHPEWMDPLFLRRTEGAARRLACLQPFVARVQSRVGAGSDTANAYVIPGASLHRELELLVDAGLSPRAALAAATRTAAEFLGEGRTLGTIEAGKIADLVVLGADPVQSLGAIRQVEQVIRDGRVVWAR